MRFAILNGIKTLPSPGIKGFCPCCEELVIPRCGKINIWHWAHSNLQHCDSWWENETQWHIDWKNHFPFENQEVVHFDNKTGEKHIADVKTNNGIVLEFQNSSITPEEIIAREKFYDNMLWVINGLRFKDHFTLSFRLPDPKSSRVKNCRKEFVKNRFRTVCDVLKKGRYQERYEKYYIEYASDFIEQESSSLYLFNWLREKKCWRFAYKRKFLDFGDEYLYELTKYKDELDCVKRWSKLEFIERAKNPKIV